MALRFSVKVVGEVDEVVVVVGVDDDDEAVVGEVGDGGDMVSTSREIWGDMVETHNARSFFLLCSFAVLVFHTEGRRSLENFAVGFLRRCWVANVDCPVATCQSAGDYDF